MPELLRRPAVLLVLSAACWGTGTAVAKQAVADMPPVSLLAAQLTVSVAFLLVVGRLRRDRLRTGPSERVITRLGLLNPGLAYALGLVGLTQISASLSVLIWAIEPIFIAGLAVALLRERLPTWLVALSGTAIAGLLVVLYDPAAGGAAAGIAISATGVVCCALYTILTRRWITGTDSTIAVVVGQELYALGFAVVMVLAVAASGAAVAPSAVTPATVASTIGSGLLYYGVAYWLYLNALRALPASVASTSFYLIPIFGLAAASLLGERLEAAQWIGAAIVIAAVGAVGLLQRRAMTAEPAPAAA